jgi:hypothetical protein
MSATSTTRGVADGGGSWTAGRVGIDRLTLQVLVVCVLAAVLRVGIAERQTLWVDEVFSLGMATGHSVDHPADSADAMRGDFAEPVRPVPAAVFQRYLEHERDPAGPGRVIRTVLRSDTSPPLYYLLLNGWTRLAGTGDVAVRMFSVLLSIACIPIAASVARRLGGRRAVLPAAVLFALGPQAVYYGTEVRMYALLIFEVLTVTWLTLRLRRRGASLVRLLPWIVASAAGLLTHYFFAFAWGALCLWLLLHPHRARRVRVLAAGAITGLVVLPWYALVPSTIRAWRVTGGWLKERPEGFSVLTAQVKLLWSYVAATGVWGTPAWRTGRFVFLLLCFVALFGLWRRRRHLATPRWQLLWLSLASVMIGLALFDGWQGTFTRHYTRYALPGITAAYLLAALLFAQLPRTVRVISVIGLVALWIPGLQHMYVNRERNDQPFREIARVVDARRGPHDLVLIASSPTGVLGAARYLDPAAVVSSWVPALRKRRVPDDIEAMLAGRRRVFYVQIARLGGSRPNAGVERYLREHARLAAETELGSARVLEFVNGGIASPPTNVAPSILRPAQEGRVPTTNGAP